MDQKYKENHRTHYILLAILLIVALVGTCCQGCAYAFIHKKHIADTYENYRTYRAHVTPTEEPEKVNQLGDLIGETLKLWKGGYDGTEESR